MAKRGKRTPHSIDNRTENKVIDLVDTLTEFEDYQRLLPKLKEALKGGQDPALILKMMTPLAAARLANIAITDPDSARALAAIKELLNRTEGTPVQRQETTHKLDKLDDQQLDALLEAETASLKRLQDDTKH